LEYDAWPLGSIGLMNKDASGSEKLKVDMARWKSPATKGELAKAISTIRHVIIKGIRYNSTLTSNDRERAQVIFAEYESLDDQLDEFISGLIGEGSIDE
jgi:hypothetical protein